MAESAVNSNGKRPADSAQSVESFAVCTNCSRLSTNLRHCDKCGAALSEDNAALCYSAEPKRARQETDTGETASNHLPNGNPSPGTNNSPAGSGSGTTASGMNQTNGSSGDGSAGPVPQALYLNMGSQPVPVSTVSAGSANTATTVASNNSGDLQILPQALYVNVNNQVFPVGGTATTASANTHVRTASSVSTAANNRLSNAVSSSLLTNQSTVTTSSPVQTGLSIVNPPIIASASHARTMASVADSAPPPPYNAHSDTSGTSSPQGEIKVCLVANQIRIGTKKFIPATTVTFKSEGVLFSLKDYSNAPVLLNARAIVHCRANMKTTFPAFYFLLESSCVKQIQNIFKLPNTVFSDNRNSIDRMRYISIFPNAVSAADAKGILQVFKMMQQRFGRPASILEEIGTEAVLDFLYSDSSSAATTEYTSSRQTSSVTAPHSMSMSLAGATINPPLPSLGQHRPSILPPASQNILGGTVASPTSLSLARAGLATSVTITQPQTRHQPPVRPAPTSGFNPGALQNTVTGASQSPPTLVIPSDNAKWAAMQKSLVAGGVYQVQFQNNAQKRYCLWDGTRFVPCLVQDTGVQLSCTHVRIGNMKSVAGGAVSIKTEGQQSGISFAFRGPTNTFGGQQKTLFIPLHFIRSCQICFDRVPSMYIYPTPQYVDYIRNQCGLRRNEYNPDSVDDRERHIILFLKDVNIDQRAALMSMKKGNESFITEMHTLNCLRILSKIKENTSLVQSRIGDFGNRTVQSATDNSSGTRNGAAAARTPIDDDDDDVIMTSEEIGIKCPYTQQVMKEPVRNKHCGHNYEKAAIVEFIRRRAGKGNARCPYAGCGNSVTLSMIDLEDNWALRDHIRKTTGQT